MESYKGNKTTRKQIVSSIQMDIIKNRKIGEKLPSESEYANLFGTARSIFRELSNTNWHIIIFICIKAYIAKTIDRDFQALLKKLGAPRYSPLHTRQKSFYLYECNGPQCHKYLRNRRINLRKMRCSIDGATLKLVSERHLK